MHNLLAFAATGQNAFLTVGFGKQNLCFRFTPRAFEGSIGDNDRLLSLCRQGGVGWLAASPNAWMVSERGTPVPSRAARVLQRAVHLSSFTSFT